MRKILLMIGCLALTGCVTYNTELHNPKTGQQMTCHETAPWGIMGLVAEHHHDECVHQAVEAGFTE
jgi:hypothetical protein